ncbi:hypothetical protein OH77DRAFT_1383263, partial [Trametes cingulata]
RLQRWMEYVSRFDSDILWVEGITNQVADALSRYYIYEEANAPHPPHDLVLADAHLDPDGTHLTRTACSSYEERLTHHLRDHATSQPETPTDDPVAVESTAQGPALDTLVESEFDLRCRVKEGYPQDPFFCKILDFPDEHALIKVREGLIW